MTVFSSLTGSSSGEAEATGEGVAEAAGAGVAEATTISSPGVVQPASNKAPTIIVIHARSILIPFPESTLYSRSGKNKLVGQDLFCVHPLPGGGTAFAGGGVDIVESPIQLFGGGSQTRKVPIGRRSRMLTSSELTGTPPACPTGASACRPPSPDLPGGLPDLPGVAGGPPRLAEGRAPDCPVPSPASAGERAGQNVQWGGRNSLEEKVSFD